MSHLLDKPNKRNGVRRREMGIYSEDGGRFPDARMSRADDARQGHATSKDAMI